jgi:ribonuclease HI
MVHEMMILSEMEYGTVAYELVCQNELKSLEAIHSKRLRIALGAFCICRSENILCESGFEDLTNMSVENIIAELMATSRGAGIDAIRADIEQIINKTGLQEYQRVFTDGSLIGNKVGCAIVTTQTNIKIRPTTIFNAELQAILEAIKLMRRNNVVTKIIFTNSLSNLIPQQNLITKKNPKAAELRDLMAEEGNNLKLMWVPAHTGIKENKEADRDFLEQELETTHKVDKTDWSG